MITLTPEDIAAIADAVVARLQGAAVNPVLTVEMTDKAKRMMEIRQVWYEVGKASKGQNKRRTTKPATTTASTEEPKGARKTTDV